MLVRQLILTLVPVAFGATACVQDALLLEATVAQVGTDGGTLKSADGRFIVSFLADAARTPGTVTLQLQRSGLPSWAESPVYQLAGPRETLRGAEMTIGVEDEICPEGLAISDASTPYPAAIGASAFDWAVWGVRAPVTGPGTFTLALDRARLGACAPDPNAPAEPEVRPEPWPVPAPGTCPSPPVIIGHADGGTPWSPIFAGIIDVAESGPATAAEPQLVCTDYYYQAQIHGTFTAGAADYFLFEVRDDPTEINVQEHTWGDYGYGLLDLVLYDPWMNELARSRGPVSFIEHRVHVPGMYVVRVSPKVRRPDYRFNLWLGHSMPDGGGTIRYEDWANTHDGGLPPPPPDDAGP